MILTDRFLQRFLVVLTLIGLGISTYSFLHNQAFVSGAICSINATFDCDVVNRGPYSQLFGVPVALIGMIGYGLMLLASLMQLREPGDRGLRLFLLLASLGGLGFSLYLTSIEAFILHTWCLLCLTSQATILLIVGSTVTLWQRGRIKPGTQPIVHGN